MLERGVEGSKRPSCFSFGGAEGAKVPFLNCNDMLSKRSTDATETKQAISIQFLIEQDNYFYDCMKFCSLYSQRNA